MEHALRKTVALADAELSAADVPMLVQELAHNPSLVRALQIYIAMGRRRLGRPYDAKRDQPVPQWLVDTVMRTPIQRQPLGFSPVAGAVLRRLKNKYKLTGWSLAAGPAFAAGVAGFLVWMLVPAPSQGGQLMTAQLQSALERTVSGRSSALPGFRPLLTYWSNDQAWCREFEVQSVSERTFAVACRENTGSWRIVMQTPPMALGTAPAGSPREQLDRYVGSSGKPVDSSQVAEVIRSEWSPPSIDK
jgi:hypothetical protein